MSLIGALVQELLKFFVGGLKAPGGMGLLPFRPGLFGTSWKPSFNFAALQAIVLTLCTFLQ